MPRETVGKTFLVAILLCLVCSFLVSSAAVYLRPTQAVNKALDKKRNILMAAGLEGEGKSIDELFAQIEPKVVDLATGEYVDIDPAAYDQRRAAKDPAQSVAVSPDKDRASIKRKAKYASVYLVRKGDQIKKLILPVHGLGLWSTLYGFIALDYRDLNTIKGLVYYEHAETPGLGGEVDNPAWKALWNGKKVFDEKGDIRIDVIKGKVNPARPGAQYQVDGISGATITARGVKEMLRYWLDEEGFGPYLARLKAQGVRHG
ncbi:MAG: Na(+)-translocating NADH-quinone reductase subunit C [Candidatus Latescibacteria bacterium]|nr:Na(+)-translocating NADH-quinone reductase subunit C [Candidatus Latescibacterota bacterium]